MEPQMLKVNPRYDNSKPTKMVQICFPHYTKDNYYMGNKWDDLVVSELEFYGVSLDPKLSSTSVTANSFNLMTLIDAFKNNLNSGKKGFIAKIMEGNLGFKFSSKRNTTVTLEDPSEGEYQEDAMQYTFIKDEIRVEVVALEYNTHTHIKKFVLKFEDKTGLDNFVKSSKDKMGNKFNRYYSSGYNWTTKVSGNQIVVNISESN